MDCSCQIPLSMGLPRWEYGGELSCFLPGDLANPGVEPVSLVPCTGRRALQHWCRPGSCFVHFVHLSVSSSLGLVYGNVGGLGKEFLPGEPVFASARPLSAARQEGSACMSQLRVSVVSSITRNRPAGRHSWGDRSWGRRAAGKGDSPTGKLAKESYGEPKSTRINQVQWKQ